MVAEESETLAALEKAIQLEIAGKEYYLRASLESGNNFGRELLKTLAQEEDIHRQKFEEVFNTIREKMGWPVVRFDGGKRLKASFDSAVGIGKAELANARAGVDELRAVEFAIELENKTYEFYKAQSGKAGYVALREFYEALMIEENRHRLALLDYHEYLKSPTGWFVRKERPSFDGA